MREVYFLQKNKDKWKYFEEVIDNNATVSPDKLADLYIDTMDDLSYARTFYPESKTLHYLNQLSSKIHQTIYMNKKEGASRIITFWTLELPKIFYEIRKYLLISFLLFDILYTLLY